MNGGSGPAIVVSLPARSLAEARSQIRIATEAGADLAEVRFDRWPADERRRAAELFPSPLPLVATLRSRREGGEGPDEPADRAEILSQLARLPFRWIDLEVERDSSESWPPGAESVGQILSTHRLREVEPSEWAALLRSTLVPGSVRKVVVPSNVGTLLTELLPGLPPPGEGPLVALTTGPSGPLLRAWSRRLRYPLVYAALPEPTSAGGPDSTVEPSQIPVDRLRPFLTADGGGPIFGLAGRPVAHSRSPSIHTRWMRRTGRVGLYVALEFSSEEEFVESLPGLVEGGFRGLNVTHPFKRTALETATDVGSGATACGVANCLTFREGTIEAENTDLAAIVRRLDDLRRAGRWDGRELAVVGGGGAARATLAGARALGAQTRVYGRNSDRIAGLAREFGARSGTLDTAAASGLVVHATDVGRSGNLRLEVPLERLVTRGTHVIDWVYAPVAPTVADTVARAGGTYEDGRRLLVYQAAASFGLWWGEEPAPEEIARTLREEGCAA